MGGSFKDTWGRSTLVLKDDAPEHYIARACIYPFQGNTSGQRRDLMNNFEQAIVIPVEPEVAIVESMLAQDMLKYSSIIKNIHGKKLTLVEKITFQLRTIYIYILDGVVHVYDDNSGTVVHQKSVNNVSTDFDKIKVGSVLNLQSPDASTFYEKYPDFFNPTNGLIGYGKNILSRVDVNIGNSQDSVEVSESFVNKFTVRRTKTVHLNLAGKRILSRYENIFPPIGEVVEEQFLCKLVSQDGDMFTLAQSENVPSGEEDETVVMDQTSMLVSIEVYCNEHISTCPILEKLRTDLIDFRTNVYYALEKVSREYTLSERAQVYLGNFQFVKFRTNSAPINKPLIILRIDSLSKPGVGYKFSNRYGGKYTIQNVYKDGYIKDEYGRNIELTYGGLGIINRMIPGTLMEVWFTAFSVFLANGIRDGSVTVQNCVKFYKFLYTELGHGHDFKNVNLTNDEWKQLILMEKVPIILMPISTVVSLKSASKIRQLAKELFNYRKTKIYIGGKHSGQESTVGYMYTVRLSQDPEMQTSVVATAEVDSRGFIKDDDSTKKRGLSHIKRKATKHCIQTNQMGINMVPDSVLYEDMCTSDDVMKISGEYTAAIGVQLKLGDDTDEDDIY